jgi:HSP20 family protein
MERGTAAIGSYPPINIFQQGHDLVAIVELPGVDKSELQIKAKEGLIRLSGRKAVSYDEGTSMHRRERLSGVFDRTLAMPVKIDPDGVKAEYRDGYSRCSSAAPKARNPRPSGSHEEWCHGHAAGGTGSAQARVREEARGHHSGTGIRAGD